MMSPLLNLPHPAIMGILNVTPDSFSDGGKYNTIDTALSHAEDMLEQGADLIDLGGCSTRPNNAIATEDEELQRVIPVLQALKKHFPKVLISIDTFRKNVAQACMEEGADIINDISGGLFDPDMLPYIGENHIPYIMMHCVGTPETMHQYSLDGDIHQTVMDFFQRQCAVLEAYGPQQIVLDPGIGFGKSLQANYALLSNLDRYRCHHYPILIGVSRKSLIRKFLESKFSEYYTSASKKSNSISKKYLEAKYCAPLYKDEAWLKMGLRKADINTNFVELISEKEPFYIDGIKQHLLLLERVIVPAVIPFLQQASEPAFTVAQQ